MKIAILGYGKMGREIEKTALERNHEVVLKIDISNAHELSANSLGRAEVAIDFSTPGSAYTNILACFDADIPVVCGTTGWLDKFGEVRELCLQRHQTFFYASNFSLGANVFFSLNRYLGRIMENLPAYDVEIKETHHIHKVDAPSGTAITLANDLISVLHRKQKWELNQASDRATIKISSIREGEVPGTHSIVWDSPADRIEIVHEAKSRKGLALGALLAAEFIRDKKGIYSMEDLIRL